MGGRIFLRYSGYCKNQDHEDKNRRFRAFHSSSISSLFFSPKKKTASLALIVSFGILLWSTSSAFQKDDLFTYAQVAEVQQ
ncbi:MAG: hypothetical protein WAM88_12380, partial [Nitrososphaeraceae archaeon]